MQTEKDFLIALMNNTRDFNIAQSQNWYRIPCSTKIVPKSVLEKTLKYIAFYQTKIFGDQAFSVRWFAEVKSITVTKRKFLLPEFKNDPKAENDYYKIEFEPLQELNVPIISLRPRRLLFIPTTLWLFQNARNINELFCDSPLENEFWAVLKKEKIEAERQYYISTGYNKYLLDFAVFCKHCKIDIECDGDEYHLSEFNVKKDKRRNNILTELGWSVLRFTTSEIRNNINATVSQIKATINRCGGLEVISEKTYKFFEEDGKQPNLFDA